MKKVIIFFYIILCLCQNLTGQYTVPLTIGPQPFTGNASLHIGQSYGGFDRLTQMNPIGVSKPGLNIMASTNTSGSEQWWTWGVTPGNVWRIQDGTAFNGEEGFSITSDGRVGIGTSSPSLYSALSVKGNICIGSIDNYIMMGASAYTGTGGTIYLRADGGNNFAVQNYNTSGWFTNLYINGDTRRTGIGTSTPQSTLHVSGTCRIDGKTQVAATNLDNTSFNTLLTIEGNVSTESANNNFDVTKPSIGLVFKRDWASLGTPKTLAGIYAWGSYNWAGGLAFTTTPAYGNGVQYTRMVITDDGFIGIGNTNPGNFKLNVSGKIRADEIVVNTGGADFVFESGYELPDLFKTEAYIKEFKRLPEIPSAKEMQENGMNMSEMQTKLLQKIEELTLYIIDQQKEIKILKQEITELKN